MSKLAGNSVHDHLGNTVPTRKVTLCHSGPQLVFTVNKARIWAARGRDIKRLDRWDLLIPLADDYATYIPTNPISSNQQAKEELPASLTTGIMPPVMTIDWPDQGIPHIGKKWWKDLADYLIDFNGDVAFFCMGGHGRTGTALTIMSILCDQIPDAVCPLYWLRDTYCEEAVESYEQVDYIEHITGEVINAEPSNVFKMAKWSQEDIPGYMGGTTAQTTPPKKKEVKVEKGMGHVFKKDKPVSLAGNHKGVTTYKANYPGRKKKKGKKKRDWIGRPMM